MTEPRTVQSLHDLALFPLGTVLFPGGFLPLRIFEPRYLDMVSQCLQAQAPFGVVLIREGREAGVPALPWDVGTLATIVDFDRSREGMLLVACIGGDRFRIRERRLQDNALQRADVELLAEATDRVLASRHAPLAAFLRQVVNQAGLSGRISPPDIDYSSCLEVGYRLAEVLPVEKTEQQLLLEMDDPVARLDAIDALLRRLDFTLDA